MTSQEHFLQIGSLLNNRYVIEAEVGRGGYSVVYKAQDQILETTVAIKLLVPPPVAAISAKERLRREVMALQTLNHPSIIRIYDLHDEGHWSFMIMDYIDGGTLDQYVARHGPLTQDTAKAFGRHIAEALVLAHRHGILHRDVKPQNMMITSDHHAVLTDFGSAKIEGQATVTATGAYVGTMDYLAPEVFDGNRPDGRSDIYSLGISLYFALTGTLPDGPSKHMPPTPQEGGFHPSHTGLSISPEFDHIIARATAAAPSDRFHTMESMTKALTGEWTGPVIPQQSSSLKFCLRCGGPDLLLLSVCPTCRTQKTTRDTLIMIEKDLEPESRTHVLHTLETITAHSQNASCLQDTAQGTKALLQVPQAAAPEIVAKLRARQIPATWIPRSQAFSKTPYTLRFLLSVNFWFGAWIGLMHFQSFLLISPLVVGAMSLATRCTIRTPLIQPRDGTLNLPDNIETQVFSSIANLPSGSAQDLLSSIVRTGASLYKTAKNDSYDPLFAQKLTAALDLACSLAAKVSQLDQTLVHIAKQAQTNPTERKFIQIMSECELHRDKLVQKLLELLATLTTMHTGEGNSHDSSLEEFSAITKELEEDSKIRMEAAAEVQEYLEASEKEGSVC